MRDIQTKAPDMELPDLTDQQMKFVLAVLDGKTYTDAYKSAYNVNNMADKTIWAEASRTASNRNVSAWIAQAKREKLSQATFTHEVYVKELWEHVSRCIQSGNMGAATKTLELLGRATGHDVHL